MRYFFWLLLYVACTAVPGFAQPKTEPANTTAGANTPPLNQTDARGRRQGMWWIEQPERMGEPGYTEFGSYDDGRKYGAWYKTDGDGNVAAIEHYQNGVLNGEVKYFERGQLTTIGNYRGLNPNNALDTIFVDDPVSGREVKRVISTDKGTLRHGMWRYYDPETGRLIREEDYQIDNLIYRKNFELTRDDSTYFQKRMNNLLQNKKMQYKPPKGKPTSYIH